MEKASREIHLINPRNLGQALGFLVAPVMYIQPAHIYLYETFCLAFCCPLLLLLVVEILDVDS